MTPLDREKALLVAFKADPYYPHIVSDLLVLMRESGAAMTQCQLELSLGSLWAQGLIGQAKSEFTRRVYWALSGKGFELLGVV